MNYFETKVKYRKIDDKTGKEKIVTEKYLLDAVSFTEAETRISEELSKFISGEFVIMDIKRSNITDIFNEFEAEIWFKGKINYISVDESVGREKKITQYMLIMADDIDGAFGNLKHSLSGMVIDYEIESISDSKIIEFYPYKAK